MEPTSETPAAPGGTSSRIPLAIGGAVVAAVAIVAWIQYAQSQAVRAELKAVSERLAEVSSSAATDALSQRERSEALDSAVTRLRSDITGELGRQRAVTEALQTEVKRSLEKVAYDSLEVKNSLVEQVASSSATVRMELDRQAAGLSSLETEVRRALGHVVIEEAPPELAVAVRQAVQRWLPAEGGQVVPESSEEIRSDLAFLEQSMGTGLDQAFRSEVRLLSWWADAVDLHHAVGNQLDRAPSVYESAQSLRLSTPMKAPNWAFDVVLAAERNASIEIARLAVSKPFTNTDEIDAAVAILDQLGRELGSDAPAFIVEERQKLVAKGKELEDRNLGQILEALKTQRAAAIKSAGNDRLRLQVQAGFDGQVMGLLSSMGEVTTARRKEVEGLVQAWQAETRKLENQIRQREMLRYQKWALDQMDRIYMASKRDCEAWNGDDVWCQLEKMKEFLVPIDTNLLEPPVREKFMVEWEYWKRQIDSMADGDKPLKDLIKSIGEIEKKGLGEV